MVKTKRSSKSFNQFSFLKKLKQPKVLVLVLFVVGFGAFGVYKLALSSAYASETVFPATKMAYSGGGTGGTSRRAIDGSVSVIELRTKTSPKATATTSGNGTLNISLPSGTYAARFCTWVKRLGTANFSISTAGYGPYIPGKLFTNMSISSNYIKVCGPYAKTYGKSGKYRIDVVHDSGAAIRVSSVVLDWY